MRDLITVIDIGTTKISFAICKIDNRKFEINFLKSYPSAGLKKGKVTDMEALTSSIKNALKCVEDKLNIKLKKAFICSSAADIKGILSNATVKIGRKEITEKDVDLVIEAATERQLTFDTDRQAVHILPVEFIIDGIDEIKDPVGMKGLNLEAKVYIVTAPLTYIQSLVTCCNRAGIEVEEFILQNIASSEAVLTEHDKEMGTLVADIGGGSIDIAIFYDGYLRHVSTYGMGGNYITNDLAVGLKIPFNEAERIKVQFGVALPGINFGNIKLREVPEEIEIKGLDRHLIKIPLSIINEIIYARCEEILEIIKREIVSISSRIPVSSVVFTGGASLMREFVSLAEGFLSVPARIGKPDIGIMAVCTELGLDDSFIEQNEDQDINFSPEFSSTIGTFIYAIKTKRFQKSNSNFGKIFYKFTTWMKDFIKI